MNCFYHEAQVAVGTCKSCGKGLCRECAVDLTKGLACRGRCEADTQALIQLIDRNIGLAATTSRTIQQGRRLRFGAGGFHLVFGLLFVAFGVRNYERIGSLFIIMGSVFIAYGIYWLVVVSRQGKNKQP